MCYRLIGLDLFWVFIWTVMFVFKAWSLQCRGALLYQWKMAPELVPLALWEEDVVKKKVKATRFKPSRVLFCSGFVSEKLDSKYCVCGSLWHRQNMSRTDFAFVLCVFLFKFVPRRIWLQFWHELTHEEKELKKKKRRKKPIIFYSFVVINPVCVWRTKLPTRDCFVIFSLRCICIHMLTT